MSGSEKVQKPAYLIFEWSPKYLCTIISAKIFLFITAKDAFYLISRLDGRVVQGKADSNTQMMTKDDSDPTQLWVTSDYGQQLINVGTNLPFQANEGRSWIWDQEGKVLIDARKPNKVG